MPLLYTAPMTISGILNHVEPNVGLSTMSGQLKRLMSHQKTVLNCDQRERRFVKTYIETSNIFIVGDLHGNFLKLLGALIQCDFMRLSPIGILEVQDIYESINPLISDVFPKYLCTHRIRDAEQIKTIIKMILTTRSVLNQSQILSKKIIFCGDTLFDRGFSDFFTLCVFDWMRENNFKYEIIIGNHELRIFTQNAFFVSPSDSRPGTSFQSFDYWRHAYTVPRWREVFLEMFKNSWLAQSSLYLKYCEHGLDTVILTHAPLSHEKHIDIIQDMKAIMESIWSKNLENDQIFNQYIRQLFLLFVDNKHPLHQGFGSTLLRSAGLLQSLLLKLISFSENRLRDKSLCRKRVDTAKNMARLRTRMDATIFFDSSFQTSVMMSLGDCNVFGHEGDLIPRSVHHICVDSELGKPKRDSGMFRCVLLSVE